MKKPVTTLDDLFSLKDRREFSDLIRNSFSLHSRFICGVELDSLRQTYVLPCPVRAAVGCSASPCTREAILLDGSLIVTACATGFSFGLLSIRVAGKVIAYVQVGPFFATRGQKEAFFVRRPELRGHEAFYPQLSQASTGALTLIAEWLNSVVKARVDQQELAKKETLLLFLVDSTRSIASMADTEDLLNHLTDASINLTEAFAGFIFRLDERGTDLQIAHARGVSTGFNRSYRLPVGSGVTGWVARNRQPLYVPDTAKEPRYLSVGYRAASELAVPISVDDRLIGVLTVDSMVKDGFTEFDRQLIGCLASQVAKVMEAVDQRRSGTVKLKQLEALHAVSQAVNSTLELKGILEAVLQTISQVFQAAGCTILLSDGDRAEALVKVSEEPSIKTVKDLKVEGDRGILGYMLKERQPLLLHDEDGEHFERFRKFISADISSILCAPLIAKDDFLGTLVVTGRPEIRFDKGDLDLLVTMAGQVSQALAKARLYDRSQRQVVELSLINELGKAINSSLDLDDVLDYIINMLSSILEAESGSLMLLDKDKQNLRVVCSKGLDPDSVSSLRFSVGDGVAGWVAKHRKAVRLEDASKDPRFIDPQPSRPNISMISAPIVSKGAVIGVINFERLLTLKRPFTEEDLELLSTLAGQAAMAIDNASLYSDLIQVHFETIQSLANALEAKDSYTHGHSRRVSKDSVRIAQKLNLSSKAIETIRHAALLHDIGKIGVKDSVLLKPGRLNDSEYNQIKRHSVLGSAILEHVEHLKSVAKIVRHHHERMDGLGYPDRIKGSEIPLGSRIIGICDAFDAMITTRPYREGLSIDSAVAELSKNRGTQFDPVLVDIFVEILKEHHPALAPALDRVSIDAGARVEVRPGRQAA